jgi:hypothetical protein
MKNKIKNYLKRTRHHLHANVDSDFTVASTSGGDASFTVKLLAGGSLVGPYKNITGLTGDILCFKSDEL